MRSRLVLINPYEEAWRTFSWCEHLTLDLPPLHEVSCVSGESLVLPVYEVGGELRSFVVQSIPSLPAWNPRMPLTVRLRLCRAVLHRRCDARLVCCRSKARQYNVGALILSLVHVYSSTLPCSGLVRALSTGQSRSLSANGGVLRLESFPNPSRIANTRYATRFSA